MSKRKVTKGKQRSTNHWRLSNTNPTNTGSKLMWSGRLAVLVPLVTGGLAVLVPLVTGNHNWLDTCFKNSESHQISRVWTLVPFVIPTSVNLCMLIQRKEHIYFGIKCKTQNTIPSKSFQNLIGNSSTQKQNGYP